MYINKHKHQGSLSVRDKIEEYHKLLDESVKYSREDLDVTQLMRQMRNKRSIRTIE